MMDKPERITDKSKHPLHAILAEQQSCFSSRLLLLCCDREMYKKSCLLWVSLCVCPARSSVLFPCLSKHVPHVRLIVSTVYTCCFVLVFAESFIISNCCLVLSLLFFYVWYFLNKTPGWFYPAFESALCTEVFDPHLWRHHGDSTKFPLGD